MRTAVVRINVDPGGELAPATVRQRMGVLTAAVVDSGMELVQTDLATLPSHRRELQFLVVGDDAEAMRAAVTELCAGVFGTSPVSGAVTYLSRGTDDDALGVLAGLGVTGQIDRQVGADGWDVVTVRLDRADLARVPESRIQTALEASLNCEVQIIAGL